MLLRDGEERYWKEHDKEWWSFWIEGVSLVSFEVTYLFQLFAALLSLFVYWDLR